MGKTKKGAVARKDLTEEDVKNVAALKKAGNDAFGNREYPKALEIYEKALKVLPADHLEAALLHSNKAACNMMLKKYKEAINECTAALETQPTYHKALVRRAKAYEQVGLYKAALGDVHVINRGENATADTEETERRLKDILAGKKASSGAVAAVAPTPITKKKFAAARAQQTQVFHAKCTLGNETRLVPLLGQCTIVELMHNVKAKFPDVGPFVLKYLDRQGDLVTLMSRQDIARAMNEAVAASEGSASGHGPRLAQQLLPPVQVHVIECAASEVPALPQSEQEEVLSMLKSQADLFHQLEARFTPKAPQAEAELLPMMELDTWMVDFAHLFREHCGLDIDKHLDLNSVAWDRIQSALELTISDEKALPLLDEAEKKFLETSAHGMQQVGNVSILRAKQLLDKTVLGGDSVESVNDQVAEHFATAESRFRESVSIKADFVDGFLCLADLEMQRAKMQQGFHAPLPRGPTREEQEAAKAAGTQKTEAQINADTQKVATEATHAALAKLPAEAAGKGAKHWKLSYAHVQAAIDTIPEAERTVKALPEQPKEGEPPIVQDEPISLYQNTLLAWGNLLYEDSQLAAATGSDWRPILDQATARFREAGCNEPDIIGALRNHYRASELDLPEPEPVAAPVAEEAPAAVTANGAADVEKVPVKGLGSSLGPAPKKKAAKEASA